MLSANVQPSEYLPSINSKVETVRLAYGSMIRLCIHSAVYYGSRGLFSELALGRRGALDNSERDAICYVLSMMAETGVSMLWAPVRYLAAVNTPRFLLDYLLTSWSEVLRFVDGFNPGRFAAYALYAFASNMDEEWNMDFFAWQVPSVILTVGKLISRRVRLGAQRCRTKRVLGVLLLQTIFRAYMSTFSVMIPEKNSEAFEAMFVTMLEGLCTAYLARHTWPFAYDEATPFPFGGSSQSASEGGTAAVSSSADEIAGGHCLEVGTAAAAPANEPTMGSKPTPKPHHNADNLD